MKAGSLPRNNHIATRPGQTTGPGLSRMGYGGVWCTVWGMGYGVWMDGAWNREYGMWTMEHGTGDPRFSFFAFGISSRYPVSLSAVLCDAGQRQRKLRPYHILFEILQVHAPCQMTITNHLSHNHYQHQHLSHGSKAGPSRSCFPARTFTARTRGTRD